MLEKGRGRLRGSVRPRFRQCGLETGDRGEQGLEGMRRFVVPVNFSSLTEDCRKRRGLSSRVCFGMWVVSARARRIVTVGEAPRNGPPAATPFPSLLWARGKAGRTSAILIGPRLKSVKMTSRCS